MAYTVAVCCGEVIIDLIASVVSYSIKERPPSVLSEEILDNEDGICTSFFSQFLPFLCGHGVCHCTHIMLKTEWNG
jgi:hypothetical protein